MNYKRIHAAGPARARRGALTRRGGFTLIELMVALSLAALLSIMIMYISTTAQQTYSSTVKKVAIYNQFRLIIDRMREDFANWIPSQEVEFYTDGIGASARRNFHFDPGEEVPDRSDQHGNGVVDGGLKGVFDEYAYIVQRQYESIEQAQREVGDLRRKRHDCYECYFRTMTYVDGLVREANVEYRLVDPTRPKSEWDRGVPPAPTIVDDPKKVPKLALYKIVRYFNIDERIITKINQYPIERRISEVATNVTDFRIEYMTQNPFSRNSRAGGPKFVTPAEDYAKPAEMATRPVAFKRAKVPGRMYRKTFGYGTVKLGEKFDLATAQPAKFGDQGLKNFGTLSEPVRIGFRSNPRVSFAEIVPGDSVYFFTQSDRGVGGASGASISKLAAFPTGDYQVKANIQGMLELVEDIDSSTWGDKDQTAIYYKAAFLPSAIRLTIRMVDDDGLNPKTMQQVVRLKRKSR